VQHFNGSQISEKEQKNLREEIERATLPQNRAPEQLDFSKGYKIN